MIILCRNPNFYIYLPRVFPFCIVSWLKVPCLECEIPSRCFQPGEGPSSCTKVRVCCLWPGLPGTYWESLMHLKLETQLNGSTSYIFRDKILSLFLLKVDVFDVKGSKKWKQYASSSPSIFISIYQHNSFEMQSFHVWFFPKCTCVWGFEFELLLLTLPAEIVVS